MIRARQCRYCRTGFTPSSFHPEQRVCFSDACRLQRKRDYRREHYRSDEVYRQVCLESTKKWRQSNPDYSRKYRRNHPQYVAANRSAQKRRDQARRLHHLAKNNLALTLDPLRVEVLLVGRGLGPLVKNNLAISQVVLMEPLRGFATLVR